MQPSIPEILCLILAGHPEDVDWPAFSLADWDRLVTGARREGVAPLLYHTLEEAGWPVDVPDRTRGELQSSYYTATAHNLLIYHELSRILTALTNQPTNQPTHKPTNQPIILLKGAALAATVYPDIGLRPMSDLDLLVPRRSVEATVQAVRALGYREVYPEMTPGLNWPAGYHKHLRGGPQQSVDVELHWGLIASGTDWRSPSLDWFWDNTEAWKVENGTGRGDNGTSFPISILHPPSSTLQLAPTAHLLYLAAHLMLQHGGAQARLIWYYDIHLLIDRKGEHIDWDELLERARELRWSAALRAALEATRAHFGTPLPQGVLDALAHIQDTQATRLVRRKTGSVQTQVAGTWGELTAVDWPTRLRLAWSIACPSPTYVRWRYKPQPAWLWPLYYPYRWLDILRDGLSTLWRVAMKKIERRNGQ